MISATLSRFFPPPKYLSLPAFGLDISDRAVKYVELLSSHGTLRLGRYGEEEIPAGVVTHGVITDQDKLRAILTGIRESTGLSLGHVSLPEEKAYIVEMKIPAGSATLLRQSIELHLEEQVPLQAPEAVFDFEIVHSPAEAGEDSYLAVVSAVEAKLAQSYVEALESAGFLPLGFEFESQALARAVTPARGGSEVSMLVDIGREQSNVAVVSKGLVRLSSSINIGGDTISRAIQKDLSVSAGEALHLKEEAGLLRPGSAGPSPFESIVRVATVLRDEIYQRLNYWNRERERSGRGKAITAVILCGGNANVPGLPEYLTGGLDLPVSLANPWLNILSFDEIIPELDARQSLKYCTALGLALRSIEALTA